MEGLLQDLRYALRMLLRAPSFSIVAIAVLAVGIGAGTAVFSIVNAVLLRPLPYREPDRLALIEQSLPQLSAKVAATSAAEYWDYREKNRVFSDVAAFTTVNLNLTGDADPVRIQVARVSASLFPLLGVPPALGRTFTDDEDEPGNNSVVLISERLWRDRFGMDSSVAGRAIRLDESPYTIVGVMPARFQFPAADNTFSDGVDLWVPLAMNDAEKRRRADSFDYGVVGRLKPGLSLENANSDISLVAEQMQQEHPDVYQGNIRVVGSVAGLQQKMVNPVR
ncbi:MAG TPA: ABC transporter permease, partial [Blastocatellia bacterium]|nr:ABC transporter permease [Blastocatellia bacterium]